MKATTLLAKMEKTLDSQNAEVDRLREVVPWDQKYAPGMMGSMIPPLPRAGPIPDVPDDSVRKFRMPGTWPLKKL